MIDGSLELPAIAKLQYLLSSLKGDAATPYEHVTLTAENYASTWRALLKRYDNPRLLIREYYLQLHQLPAIRSEGSSQLMQLIDDFSRHVNGLVKLGEPVEHWDTPLTSLLLMKLDDATVLAWEKHSVHFPRDRYEELKQFVEDRIQILTASSRFAEDRERKGTSGQSSVKVAGTHRHTTSRHTVSNAATTIATGRGHSAVHQSKCPVGCATPHSLRDCPEFIGKDAQQRRELVAARGACWNCLSLSHLVKACKSCYTCHICRERHHTLLHVTAEPSKVAMSVLAGDERVFLETVVVDVIDEYGGIHKARALLDSGSMANFMSAALARRLIAPRHEVDVAVAGIGRASQRVKTAVVATIRSRIQSHSSLMEFLVLEAPAADVPSTPIDVSGWRLPEVPLADPSFNIPSTIDIIIGGDSYWELHSGRKLSLGKDRPWLIETPFGWVVAGNSAHGSVPASTVCHLSTPSPSLESCMERFWQSETVTKDVPVRMADKHSSTGHGILAAVHSEVAGVCNGQHKSITRIMDIVIKG
ncbi:uncharacterized protein LOC125955490 [Anopheles darlingi]|uniref:uncharacterized protein LOC125955490 n=1 Tax=Anopheles darlingi TaxID=43151 RepID=UPI0021000F1B|nr:uncharacterized protein LOC125955490 [Anopheles darlingi]